MVRQLLQRVSSASQPHGASSSGSERSDDDPSSRLNLSRASSVLHDELVMRQFLKLRKTAGSLFVEAEELEKIKDLGQGSFARVEECVLRGQSVAVKRLRPELFKDLDEIKGFVTEGLTLAKLRHPCIVSIIGLGFKAGDVEDSILNDSLFMAQELCEGGSLRDLVMQQMNRYSKVVYTYADALRWSIQMAEGLAHLHSRDPQIIHRDLKLDNVLLAGRSGRWDAKIADFGLHATVNARHNNEVMQQMVNIVTSPQSTPNVSVHGSSTTSPTRDLEANLSTRRGSTDGNPLSLTDAGEQHSGGYRQHSAPHRLTGELIAVVHELGSKAHEMGRRLRPGHRGLPAHIAHDLTGQTGSFLSMAPEVMLRRPYNEKADIFSLACCIVEIFSKSIAALTVTVTGAPDEFEKIAHKVAHGYRRPMPDAWPADLRQLLIECMAQDPQDRPSARQVSQRLRAPKMEALVEAMDDRDAARRGPCCCVQ